MLIINSWLLYWSFSAIKAWLLTHYMFSVAFLLHPKASSSPWRDYSIPFFLYQTSLQFKYLLCSLSSSLKHSCLRQCVKKEREESETQTTVLRHRNVCLERPQLALEHGDFGNVLCTETPQLIRVMFIPVVCVAVLSLLAFDPCRVAEDPFSWKFGVREGLQRALYWGSNSDPQLLLAAVSWLLS